MILRYVNREREACERATWVTMCASNNFDNEHTSHFQSCVFRSLFLSCSVFFLVLLFNIVLIKLTYLDFIRWVCMCARAYEPAHPLRLSVCLCEYVSNLFWLQVFCCILYAIYTHYWNLRISMRIACAYILLLFLILFYFFASFRFAAPFKRRNKMNKKK